MNELQIFKSNQFGEIRTVEKNGKVLFCGKDVAKALGYADTVNALKQHCKGVAKHHLPHPQNAEKQIEMSFISEGDIYRLTAKSQLPQAEKFESWIFDEVLPTIRKHGMYATDELLNNPDLLISIATKLKEERAKNIELGHINLQLEQRVAEYEPKIEYLDKILESPGTVTTTQIAADYGLSANKLNKILNEERIQRNVGGQWVLYKEHMNLGYTKSDTIHFEHSDGTPDTKMQTKWTQKGRLLIHKLLGKHGIRANMDNELFS